jgi:hypothetical protein
MLARFANDDGRLTVVRRDPKLKVLLNQAPENVGTQRHLNNWRDKEGNWHDDLEAGPLGRLDSVGKEEIDEALRFAIEADAEAHLRLLDRDLEQRATLQFFVASLMVRTIGFRELFDEAALPTLLAYMRERLEEFAAGRADREAYEAMRETLDTPSNVRLTPPPYRHLNLLVPLIEKVATRLHLDTLVGVRRVSEPLLFTGAEPVVVFPDADVSRGCSSGELLARGETPIEPWQEMDKLLEQVEARLSEVAGLAVALDPHTLLMMFHADRDDGGKLAYISSQVPPEALAGAINVTVAGEYLFPGDAHARYRPLEARGHERLATLGLRDVVPA